MLATGIDAGAKLAHLWAYSTQVWGGVGSSRDGGKA